MTILSVAQDVATYVGMARPTAVMTSTTDEMYQLQETLQEAAEQIAFDESHDWQALTKRQTETGDGATSSYSLPSDFRRFGVGRKLWTSRLQAPLQTISDLDDWLAIDVLEIDYAVGAWALVGGQIELKPTPETNEIISYYYQSNQIVAPESGNNKTRFTADTDTFRLPERLLKLCAIWVWKQKKQLSFIDDYEIYRRARSSAVVDDKPTRIVRVGQRRRSFVDGVKVAYPRSLS